MNYKIDKTIFRHRLWGEGILRSIEGTVLSIEFPQEGVKRLTEASVQSGILTIVNPEISATKAPDTVISHNDGVLRQYDTSDTVLGGKNILEAFETDDVVLFNESYTIIGEETSAKKISATYDLTIIGNITVDEIKVNGDLTIIGDISAKVLTCANTLICQGHVDADKIYVGGIVAKSVKCVEFICDGNALIETTIDIDESSRTEKTMVACEGIMGAGTFAALNAIANEYFEFSGDIQGKVLELESDFTLSEMTAPVQIGTDLSELSIEEVIKQVEDRLKAEYKQCSTLDEDAIIELTKLLGSNSLHTLADYATIFDTLTNISYQDEIDDFGDYLTVVFAKKILPETIYRYETIEHIDTLMLPEAEKVLDELDFRPKSVERIAQCIRIAVECSDVIPMGLDSVLDKIFSSFGLRYSTVKNILGKAPAPAPIKEKTVVEPVAKPVVEETEVETPADMFDIEAPKPKKFKMSKSKFLTMSIQAEAKFFGITADEQMRLASARIKTCADFLRMTEQDLREIFKKKLFLANHLYQAQQKMKAAVEEMDDE